MLTQKQLYTSLKYNITNFGCVSWGWGSLFLMAPLPLVIGVNAVLTITGYFIGVSRVCKGCIKGVKGI